MPFFEIIWKNAVVLDRPHNSAHAPCTLTNYGLKHMPRIRYTSCFPRQH
jgi:hypothetical protein